MAAKASRRNNSHRHNRSNLRVLQARPLSHNRNRSRPVVRAANQSRAPPQRVVRRRKVRPAIAARACRPQAAVHNRIHRCQALNPATAPARNPVPHRPKAAKNPVAGHARAARPMPRPVTANQTRFTATPTSARKSPVCRRTRHPAAKANHRMKWIFRRRKKPRAVLPVVHQAAHQAVPPAAPRPPVRVAPALRHPAAHRAAPQAALRPVVRPRLVVRLQLAVNPPALRPAVLPAARQVVVAHRTKRR